MPWRYFFYIFLTVLQFQILIKPLVQVELIFTDSVKAPLNISNTIFSFLSTIYGGEHLYLLRHILISLVSLMSQSYFHGKAHVNTLSALQSAATQVVDVNYYLPPAFSVKGFAK